MDGRTCGRTGPMFNATIRTLDGRRTMCIAWSVDAAVLIASDSFAISTEHRPFIDRTFVERGALISIRYLCLRPSQRWSRRNLVTLNHSQRTRMLGLSRGEKISAYNLRRFDAIPNRDRWTDGQRDRQTCYAYDCEADPPMASGEAYGGR